MGQKVQLRLLISTQMSEKGEDSVIRFPRRARDNFGFANNTVVIGKGEYEISLAARKAYRDDVRRLAKMIRSGKLTDAEAGSVGFVTRSVQQRVTRRSGRSVWISEGVGRITIGCDPEFGLIDNNGVLQRGSTVLPNTKRAKFGADGPGVEVRPDPARDHIALIRNIQGIFEKPPGATESYRWRGGATYQDLNRTYWFGGHIHLGRPDIVKPDLAHPCYSQIATALDGLLALPMVAFDAPDPWKRRNGCPHKYGMAGDIRADYPEQDRFEYRVLSGLWLTHPTLAKVALGVSKCVAETAYSRVAEAKCDPEFITAPASRKGLLRSFGIKGLREIQRAINVAKPDRLELEMVKLWEKQLRDLDRYDDYAEEITALIEIVKVSPDKIIPQLNLDIRDNWQEGQPFLAKSPDRVRRALEAVEAK